MGLRRRVFLLLAGCALVALVLLFGVADRLVRRGFEQVERQNALTDLERVRSALRRSEEELRSVVRDWAPWDETYRFLRGENPGYVRDNLSPQAYRNLDLDEVVLTDVLGRVRYARRFDGTTSELRAPSKDLIALARSACSSQSGLVLSEGIPTVYAVEKVLTSTYRGPYSGWILMARRLTGDRVRRIGRIIGIPDLAILPASRDGGGDGAFAPRIRLLPDRVLASLLLPDPKGRPAVRVEIRSPRPIARTAARTVRLLGVALFLSLLGVALVGALFLHRAVVRPSLRLTDWVDRLAATGDFGLAPPAASGRDDELGRLARAVISLRDSFQALTSALPVPIFICDEEGTILRIGGNIPGAEPLELTGRRMDAVCVEGTEALDRAFREAREGGDPPPVRLRVRRRDGSGLFPADARVRRLLFGNHRFLVVSLHDQSEREGYEERLARMAYGDDLTGLPNRARFLERLREELAPGGSGFAALALINLDRFRAVNERFGQGGGDLFLLALAERLLSAFPDPDGDRVFRTGGDNFVLLLPRGWDGVPGDGAAPPVEERIAHRLQEILAIPVWLAGTAVPVSASAGVVPDLTPGEGRAEAALRDADLALAAAKRTGFGRVRAIDEGIREENRSRATLTAEIQRGIENREFLLLYQPICALDTGAALGFEALIRWDAPGRGRLSPDRFIPEAERNGLILPLGSWILDEGVAAARRLRERTGRPLYVSINVSTSQLLAENFAARLEARLEENGLPGEAIVLEITESVFAADAEAARRTLESVRRLGVPVALDDFGTGYSSLGYLNRLPVDRIKIDKSFLDPLSRDEDAPVAAALLALVRNLGLASVAEGVETERQRRWLRARGCRMGQGWLFARPLEEARAAEYVPPEETAPA